MVYFSENVFHWSKFKARLHEIFLSRIFDLLLINSRYLVFQVWEVVVQRSSRPEVFCTKDVLKYFTKLTGKHLCQSLFFSKVADLRLATLLKKRLRHRRFPVDFAKILKTTFFTEHFQWFLLKIISHRNKEILYMNTNFMGNQPWSKNKYFLLLLILMLKKPVFLM